MRLALLLLRFLRLFAADERQKAKGGGAAELLNDRSEGGHYGKTVRP